MHKYTWLVLSAATILLLTGCGKTSAQKGTTAPTTATTAVTEATQPTHPQNQEGGESDTLVTKPEETKPVETKPEETKPEETKPQSGSDAALTYAEFLEMSDQEQDAYTESFETLYAFIQWYNAAKAVYDAENVPVGTIGHDGSIDLGAH